MELDSDKAWKNILRAPAGLWSNRKAVYTPPVARPLLYPSFKVKPGAKIFTMGSCFARNIETHLATHGFDIPGHRHYAGSHVINKYNPFSMLQEVKWALGKAAPLDPSDRIHEVGPDQWVDPYMHYADPVTKEVCLKGIEKSTHLFSELEGCPYFVITLGLIEVWFDRETSTYLNWPLNNRKFRGFLQEQGRQRFVFRVLSYEESYGAVEEMFSLLRAASPHCKCILTVSPVPLSGTFSGKDVISANTYSKSVLRVVAETICSRFDWVDYFPAYESVMHHPHEMAWDEGGQGVHVLDPIVALNVGRMVQTYVERMPGGSPDGVE